jgi:hypothetical protein
VEDIPKGYQKIPYHNVFDVKYNNLILFGGYWKVNDKEDIYSGVVWIDTVRIGCFL